MNIKLKGDYVLESENGNIILKKLTGTKNKEGIPNKSIEGYHTTISSALRGYVRKSLVSSEAESVKQLLKEVRELNSYINSILGN